MSVLPPGYVSVIMPIQRLNDPDPYAVTWAFDYPGDATGPQEVADVVQNNFVSLWASSFPNDCTLGPAQISVGQDGGDPLVATAATTGSGSNSSDFAPQNCALLIQKRSNLGGRRNRGRCYFPVITEGAVNEVGELSETQVASYQSIADDWLQFYNLGAGIVGPMVILHNDGSIPPTPVATLVVQRLIATQRRRLRR